MTAGSRSTRRTALGSALAVVAGLAAAPAAHAQDWPKARPVSIIVGFAPGAFTDVIARVVAQKLGETTGGSFVVENRPGAGGNIATGQVKRAAADGYTILVHSVAYAVNPSLYPNAGYDAVKDFAALALGPRTPNIITVNPATPAKDLKELIELARREKLSYASSGIGTTTHLSVERLKAAAKVDITHVPYQPAAAITAVVAGHTPMSSTSMPPAVPQIKAGKIRAIAVTSARRSALLPDVPSVTEFGYKDFDDYTWVGFFLPAGTPPALVERINAEINKAMELPDARERFVGLGMESTRNTPAEFAAFLRDEVVKWAAVVKSTGAKAE
ncbi:MAG: tripartite tricarboxylate transporter substrate binding protein [Burkholderiales bacterium]|nr:tripartite tricarboxylate transporter substrate binding protein [Burkholderiales bacterium]